ncbi:hypothetical protein O1611_g2686 [Lasiodiplodia mahajangana]|uniref:Uncharacterized protein n=1 Tax=Lasiodiplodia mahajangana TaxID=1108764 RepID=A0ACC2JUD9_9PEZI|nr:hypothetical protein O1611_g2686 [Lasiodiplodia mahajangana]
MLLPDAAFFTASKLLRRIYGTCRDSDDTQARVRLHHAANTARRVKPIGRRQGANLCDLGRAVDEDVVSINSVSVLVTVKVCDDSELSGAEVVLFDQELCAHSAVDARCGVVFEARTEDMAGTEAERGQARVDVVPVVVVTFVEDWISTRSLPSGGLWKYKFLRITFDTPLMRKPPLVRPERDPDPMTVVPPTKSMTMVSRVSDFLTGPAGEGTRLTAATVQDA